MNLRDAIKRQIDFKASTGKEYKLRTDGKRPTLLVRCDGYACHANGVLR